MPNKILFSNVADDLKVQVYGESASGTTPLKVSDDGSVSVTGEVTVTATDLDIRNLTFTEDSVYMYGFDGTTGQIVKVDDNGNLVLTATDLDIRDLTFTQDSVYMYGFDGTTGQIVKVDDNGNLVLTATDLDIRDLSYTQDLITLGSRRVVESLDNTSILNSTGDSTPVFTTDTSIYSELSVFVKNTGTNPITFNVEVSPTNDDGYFVSDGAATTTINSGESGLIVPAKYGKYTRLKYDTATLQATAELYFIGLV